MMVCLGLYGQVRSADSQHSLPAEFSQSRSAALNRNHGGYLVYGQGPSIWRLGDHAPLTNITDQAVCSVVPDCVDQYLYYSNTNSSQSINRARYDGSDAQVVIPNGKHSFTHPMMGLLLCSPLLCYRRNYGSNKIQSAAMDGRPENRVYRNCRQSLQLGDRLRKRRHLLGRM